MSKDVLNVGNAIKIMNGANHQMVGIYVFFIIKLRLKHKNIEPLNNQDVTLITND